jgi:serine/threonine-protein kinase
MTNAEAYGIERPRITDFGVAKMTAGEITTTGQMLGTPAFMPPEQFTGAPIDGRTDLFSLGVILYWMATGEQPFPGETMTTVSYKIVHTEPVPPARLNPLVPALLDKVIMKCLSKSPADRYQSGEELAHALGEVRRGATPASLQTVVPELTTGSKDENATLDARPSLRPRPMTSSGQGAAAAAAFGIKPLTSEGGSAPKSRTGLVAAVAAIVLAAGACGWFVMHNRSQTAANHAGAISTPTVATTAATTAMKPQAGQLKTAAQPQPAQQASQQAGQAAPSPTPAGAALPRMAPVAFNPKTLDPKQNTRLKLDVSHMPPGMAFEIEMNGRLLLKSAAGNKADYDTLVVPPGVHKFRVIVGSGNTEKTSNTVSAEFVAKKRMDLKIEVRLQPKGAPAGSAGLGAGSQVLATLKEDHFFL